MKPMATYNLLFNLYFSALHFFLFDINYVLSLTVAHSHSTDPMTTFFESDIFFRILWRHRRHRCHHHDPIKLWLPYKKYSYFFFRWFSDVIDTNALFFRSLSR